MKLVEEGRIKLDEPIQTYCSAFPQKDAKVTVRRLLTHTSGVRHYQKSGESRGMEHFFTVRDSLALFKDDPLLFAPGTKFGYSTYGFSLLGCAIEGVTGMQFDEYLRDHVFAPAGMRHTSADHHFLIIPGRARPYSVLSEEDLRQLPPQVKRKIQAGQLVNAWFHDTSMKRPGGGLLSTAEDLVRFAWAFQKGDLVSGETLSAMWSVQRLNDGAEIITPWGPLGIGWFVNKVDKPRRITASGGQIGGRASINLYPDDGVAFAIMTNLSNADISAIESELRTHLGLPETRPRPIRE